MRLNRKQGGQYQRERKRSNGRARNTAQHRTSRTAARRTSMICCVCCSVDQAARLATIYVLSTHNQPDILVQERRDARKFNALLDHTWQKLVVKRMGLHGAHFQHAVAVARQTLIVQVHRLSGEFLLTELVDAVEADFQTPAQSHVNRP